MILYMENPNEYRYTNIKLLELLNKFSKVEEYKNERFYVVAMNNQNYSIYSSIKMKKST